MIQRLYNTLCTGASIFVSFFNSSNIRKSSDIYQLHLKFTEEAILFLVFVIATIPIFLCFLLLYIVLPNTDFNFCISSIFIF